MFKTIKKAALYMVDCAKSLYVSSVSLVRGLLVSILSVFGVHVHAAVPTGVDDAFDAILADATTIAGFAAPVVLGILGLVIVFKVIKRFANQS
jgi:hypothetical protein